MSETRPSLLIAVRDLADARAWREFDAIYRPLILSYARKQGLGHDDIQDVVQEVFVKLSCKMVDFRLDPGRGRFRSWLYAITVRAVYDRWRSRRRRLKVERDGLRRREIREVLEGSTPRVDGRAPPADPEVRHRPGPAGDQSADLGLLRAAWPTAPTRGGGGGGAGDFGQLRLRQRITRPRAGPRAMPRVRRGAGR
ncbi:MAG: sigma-70 family RNA polymerase sigma factor [Singulisphaera sp.]